MSSVNQGNGINLSPLLLLLALPLSVWFYKNGIEIEDIRNFVFWIWVVCLVLIFTVMAIGSSQDGNPLKYRKLYIFITGFFIVNFILWVFMKLVG